MYCLRGLLRKNLASLLIALSVAPQALAQTPRSSSSREELDIPALTGTGQPRRMPVESITSTEIADLAPSHYRIDVSANPPDDGYIFGDAPILQKPSGQNVFSPTPGRETSRYLMLLKRTAIEEALRARGLLYLLIGGDQGVESYLETGHQTGRENLKNSLCELDDSLSLCSREGTDSYALTFALPCEVKALFGMYDERCTDTRGDTIRGCTQPPSTAHLSDKFEMIKNVERYLTRWAPDASDYKTEDGSLSNAAALRQQTLGALIFHSLQLVRMRRMLDYYQIDFPKQLSEERKDAQSRAYHRSGGTTRLEAGNVRLRNAVRDVAQKYEADIQRLAIGINTILASIPFLAVRIGDRPFYLFAYCFLQGKSAHDDTNTQWCGNGMGFPDYSAPITVSNATETFARSSELTLPDSFKRPLDQMMARLEGEDFESTERRILGLTGWAFKKMLTQALAANTIALTSLAKSDEVPLRDNYLWNLTDYCRTVGTECQILQNLARFDMLHETTKARFGTYATTDLFSHHTDRQHGMDHSRTQILRSLQRADRQSEHIRNAIDFFLWTAVLAQVAITRGIPLTGIGGIGASTATASQVALRATMTTATLLNLVAAYGQYEGSMNNERYLNTLYQGIPGRVVQLNQLEDAEQMTLSDATQFHSSLLLAATDFFVMDAIFKTTSFALRNGALYTVRTLANRNKMLEALQHSRRLAERGGIIRPIVTNRTIQFLEGIGYFGREYTVPMVNPQLAVERLATLEGRSIEWVRARLGERVAEMIQAPGRATEGLARFLHNQVLSPEAVAAGNRGFSGGLRGWFNRNMGGPIYENVNAERVASAVSAAETQLGRQLSRNEYLNVVQHLQTVAPLEYALSVPFLRSMIRTNLWSTSLLTYLNWTRRSADGNLDETWPTMVSDAGFDMFVMFFVAVRSPGAVARLSQNNSGVPSLYVAHQYTQTSTMLAPIVGLSSALGAVGGGAAAYYNSLDSNNPIDQPEEWVRYFRQARNRMVLDLAHISIWSPVRADLRNSVTESFRGGTNIANLAINGYLFFDFRGWSYPIKLNVRDAMGLDHVSEQVRYSIENAGGIGYVSVRLPGAPGPGNELIPTVPDVLGRFDGQ